MLKFDEFLRSVEINKNDTFALLLGAGASISSGIQSANDCVWEWKKDIYFSNNPNAPKWFENHKLDQVREAIQNWLDHEGSYLPLGDPNEYSFYIEKCYKIEADRRKYFQRITEGKNPSVGYKLTCLLFEAKIVQSIWTTNFDNLTLKAAAQTSHTAIDVTLDKVDRIFRPNNHNELIHIGLHGDYRYGPLKNTDDELKHQDEIFRERLIEYLNDKHLIIIGYSGRDKSLMDALKLAYSKKGSGRLYWCGYGNSIRPEIKDLLNLANSNNRSAFFVPTDGFDKTMIRLAQVCFKDQPELQSKMNFLLKDQKEENLTTPFSIPFQHLNKIIKSNAFPIQIPNEIFKFKYKFENGDSPWAIVREKTQNTSVTAVPYKEFIWAFGTINEIQKCFQERIEGKVQRAPLVNVKLHKNTSIYHLLLATLTKALAENININSNNKDLIWNPKAKNSRTINDQIYSTHEAIRLSFHFDGQYYLTLLPDFYIEAQDNVVPKEVKQEIGRHYYEKMYNKPFNEYINSWRKKLFNNSGKKFEIEYPISSGLGFQFTIRKTPAFAQIMEADSISGIALNSEFPKPMIKYDGIHYKEPELVFSSRHKGMQKPVTDFHPMRGLLKNHPYDYSLNGSIFGTDIQIGVICPDQDSEKFDRFLQRQNQSIPSNNINKDYLIDYPGFQSAYGIGIKIPKPDQEKWIACPEPEIKTTIQDSALLLMRSIRDRIEELTREGKNLVVVIFIPSRWNHLLSYSIDGEEFDLHNFIKAFGAEKGIATQFIQEKTIRDNLQCQINWWLSLSYYVKSMRTPWILNSIDNKTAFAGIGYSVDHQVNSDHIVLGCSHIYNSQGQGLKYKLSKVEDQLFWDRQKRPHLSYNDAFQLGLSIRELFYNAMNDIPQRVVIHKRTYYTIDEINGIKDSLLGNGVSKIDLIEITFEDDLRFVASIIKNGFPKEPDTFGVQRGTCLKLNNRSALLWSHGVVPSVRNPDYKYFLGGRYIPAPLRITKYFGEGNIGQIANEILGLSKMNWNSLDLYSRLPSTISSSNEIARIGKLLSKKEGVAYDYRYFI